MMPQGRAAFSRAASRGASSGPAKPVMNANCIRVPSCIAGWGPAPPGLVPAPLIGRYPTPGIAGRLQLRTYTRGRIARHRWTNDGPVPNTLVAEVGFLHVGGLAREHIPVLLLQVGKGLERSHTRFLR